jgi:hypothetical protein
MATVGLMSRQTGAILAEVGFLLILFAGVWLVVAQIPAFKNPAMRNVVAGIALAVAGLLLIIATRWGHFGGRALIEAHPMMDAQGLPLSGDRMGGECQ